MNTTYQDLLAMLQGLNEEQLRQDVTVFVTGVGEYYTLVGDYPMVVSDPEINDVLDGSHPYLVI